MCIRCRWCNSGNPVYIRYHDREWGVPKFDDRALFELLILELFQAGLSWETVLNKREHFRAAFDGFDPVKVSAYGEETLGALMQNRGIIRNRRKIEAAAVNAGVFLDIQTEWGSFSEYIWHFTGGQVLYEADQTRSELSDRISADLRHRGMRFIGSTIVYSYLQAAGLIYSHEEGCFLYRGPDFPCKPSQSPL